MTKLAIRDSSAAVYTDAVYLVQERFAHNHEEKKDNFQLHIATDLFILWHEISVMNPALMLGSCFFSSSLVLSLDVLVYESPPQS